MSFPLTIQNTPRWNVIDKTGIFMYVSSNDTTSIPLSGTGYISKINLITKSVVYSWASISFPLTGVPATDANIGLRGLSIDNTNTYLYVVLRSNYATASDNKIYRINLNGSPSATAWLSGSGPSPFNNMRGITIDPNGIFMYVSRGTTIIQINIGSAFVSSSSWALVTGATFQGLVIDNTNTYLYAAYDNNIRRFTISTPSTNTNFLPLNVINNTNGLVLDKSNTYMYVSDQNPDQISKIDVSSASVIQVNYFTSGLSTPLGIALDPNDTYLYAVNSGNNTITQYVVTPIPIPTPVPIADICFPSKTPIVLDQGIIPIENINSNIHTINNKKIVAITQTITQDSYLVCFEKYSLGINYPNLRTIMSKNHKIYYKGKMIEAYKFVGKFKDVKKVKYNGEILYNVLMEEHEKILVNNLLCETLHPENIIAKLYNSNFEEKYKNKLLNMMNESIIKNDVTSYKKIISRL